MPCGVIRSAAHVDGHGTSQPNRAGGKGFCAHLGQHPAHIGVADHARPFKNCAALHASLCIGQGLLQGRFCHANALHPYAKPCVVHHGEHRSHALVRFAHKPTCSTFVCHHGCGGTVQAQLMF